MSTGTQIGVGQRSWKKQFGAMYHTITVWTKIFVSASSGNPWPFLFIKTPELSPCFLPCWIFHQELKKGTEVFLRKKNTWQPLGCINRNHPILQDGIVHMAISSLLGSLRFKCTAFTDAFIFVLHLECLNFGAGKSTYTAIKPTMQIILNFRKIKQECPWLWTKTTALFGI